MAKWFGFLHFVQIFSFARHSPLRYGNERPHWKSDSWMVLLFMYSYVFGSLFWFDFNSLISSCNDLSCICSDCSFFSRFLISVILLLASSTLVCSSASSNNFPLLTTSSRDTVEQVKQNLSNFWKWVPNIDCFFMCLSSFSKLHLLAIDLRWMQNCCNVSSLP